MKTLLFLILIFFSFNSYSSFQLVPFSYTPTLDNPTFCPNESTCYLYFPKTFVSGDTFYRCPSSYVSGSQMRVEYKRYSVCTSSGNITAHVNILSESNFECETANECYQVALKKCEIINENLKEYSFISPDVYTYECSAEEDAEEECRQQIISQCASSFGVKTWDFIDNGGGSTSCTGTCNDETEAEDCSVFPYCDVESSPPSDLNFSFSNGSSSPSAPPTPPIENNTSTPPPPLDLDTTPPPPDLDATPPPPELEATPPPETPDTSAPPTTPVTPIGDIQAPISSGGGGSSQTSGGDTGGGGSGGGFDAELASPAPIDPTAPFTTDVGETDLTPLIDQNKKIGDALNTGVVNSANSITDAIKTASDKALSLQTESTNLLKNQSAENTNHLAESLQAQGTSINENAEYQASLTRNQMIENTNHLAGILQNQGTSINENAEYQGSLSRNQMIESSNNISATINNQTDALLNQLHVQTLSINEHVLYGADQITSGLKTVGDSLTDKLTESIAETKMNGSKVSTSLDSMSTSLGGVVDSVNSLGSSLNDRVIQPTLKYDYDASYDGVFTDMSVYDLKITDVKNEILAENTEFLALVKSKFSFTVSGSGYQPNNLDLGNWGMHDISIARFAEFFGGVGNIIYFLASLTALVIVLGGIKL